MFIVTNDFLLPASNKMPALLLYSPTSHLPLVLLSLMQIHHFHTHLTFLYRPQPSPVIGHYFYFISMLGMIPPSAIKVKVLPEKHFHQLYHALSLFTSWPSFLPPVSWFLYPPLTKIPVSEVTVFFQNHILWSADSSHFFKPICSI